MHVGTEKAGQIPINLLWPHWSYINSTLALTDAEKGVMTNNNRAMNQLDTQKRLPLNTLELYRMLYSFFMGD